MKQLTKEQMKEVRQARADLLKVCDFTSTASGALVKDNGKPVINEGYVCHAFLGSDWRDPVKGIFAVVSGLMYDYKESHGPGHWDNNTPQERQMYLHWLLNQSPYASAFVSKSAASALKTKAVILTGHTPGNLLGAAACASRRLWEHSKVVKIFCELVKRGVDKDVAFLLGHIADCETDPNDRTPFRWGNALSNHCSVEMRGMTMGEVKNFMSHNIINPREDYYECGRYTNYDQMYKKAGDKSKTFFQYVKYNFPYKECKEEAPKVDLNPFRKAAVQVDGTYPMCKVLDVMAKWYKTTLKQEIERA